MTTQATLHESEIESRAAKIVGYIRRFIDRRTFAQTRDDLWGMARAIAAESLAAGRDESWACRKFSRWYKREWKWVRRKIPIDGFDGPAIPQPPQREIPAWYFVTCSPRQESAVRRRYEQDLTWKQIGELHGTTYEAVVIHHRKGLDKIRSLLT